MDCTQQLAEDGRGEETRPGVCRQQCRATVCWGEERQSETESSFNIPQHSNRRKDGRHFNISKQHQPVKVPLDVSASVAGVETMTPTVLFARGSGKFVRLSESRVPVLYHCRGERRIPFRHGVSHNHYEVISISPH